MFLKRILLLFFLLIFMSPVYGRQTKEISLSSSAMPGYLDPLNLSSNVSDKRIIHLLYRGLLGFDESGRFSGDLAESFQFDGRDVIIKLKADMYWPGAGNMRITADDIVFSFEVYKNDQNKRIFKDYTIFDFFEDPEKIDQLTVKVPMTVAADTNNLYGLLYPLLPKHKLGGRPKITEGFGLNPVGAGPFRKYEHDVNKLILTANPNYFKGQQEDSFKKVTLKHIPNQMMYLAYFQVGTDNVYIDVSPQELTNVRGLPNVLVRDWDSKKLCSLVFNFDNEFLKLPPVREAIVYSINRAEMFEATYLNSGILVSGPFPLGMAGRDPSIRQRTFDPAHAQQLMADAGFEKNAGTGRWEKGGQEVVLKLTYPQSDQLVTTLMNNIKTQLSFNGFKIVLNPQPGQNYETFVFEEHNFDIAYVTWSFSGQGSVERLFRSDEIREGGFNVGNFSDMEVDQVLASLRLNDDPEQRLLLKNELHRLLYEKLPYCFLWSPKTTSAYYNTITNFEIHQDFYFYYVDQWRYSDR